jgi:arylsulfatase A-like enzyme
VVAASVLLVVIGVRLGLGFRCVEVRAGADGSATPAAADPTRPNVVLMVLDTLRADHLSGHGYPRPTTPTLDGLAAAGLSFPLAYAQASWTRPSTASILSSLYPSQHGHGGNQTSRLADAVTTLPEVLRAAGYETAAFSSNGNVIPEAGFAQGFDLFNACEDVGRSRSSLVLGAWKRLDALVAWLTGSASPLRFTRVQKEVDGVVGNRKSDVIADEAFERWFEGRRHDRPFFAYLHLMSPHVPYDPSPESRKLVGAPPDAVVRHTPTRSDDCFSRGEAVSSERRQELIVLYDACIRDADGFVASVLARLERHGLAERTMIVIMADHGEEFYEHANWGHGQSLYEELTRIPLIIRRPGGREAGRQLAAPVMAVDVMPTILAEVGVPPPPEAVGRSLLDRESSPHDVAISEMIRPACSVWTLVRERRKYLEWRRKEGGEGSALYDLERDPGEQTAITGDGTQELATRLAQHRRDASRIVHESGEDALSPQQEDRLRALGYIR